MRRQLGRGGAIALGLRNKKMDPRGGQSPHRAMCGLCDVGSACLCVGSEKGYDRSTSGFTFTGLLLERTACGDMERSSNGVPSPANRRTARRHVRTHGTSQNDS